MYDHALCIKHFNRVIEDKLTFLGSIRETVVVAMLYSCDSLLISNEDRLIIHSFSGMKALITTVLIKRQKKSKTPFLLIIVGIVKNCNSAHLVSG